MTRTSSMNLIILILLMATSLDASFAFTSSFSNRQLFFTSTGPSISPRRRLSSPHHSFRDNYSNGCINSYNTNLRERETAADDDYSDDGWGDDEEEVVGTNSASSSQRKSDRSRELTMLQEDLASKRVSQRSFASRAERGVSEETDFFIPIVTLVSVIGFTGLYGYEMLRLYANGELYLPWN